MIKKTATTPLYFSSQDWDASSALRLNVIDLFEQLLLTDLKYCREENVDQHIWKMLYHNPLEALKKTLPIGGADAESTELTPHMITVKATCLKIIDEGMKELERLLHSLEQCYKFQLDDFIDNNAGGKNYIF